MLLFCDPPMYGRDPAGTRLTTTGHHNDDTATTTAAPARCANRRRTGAGAASRYTSPNAGSTKNAASSLARKAKPTATPASASQRPDAFSVARTTQYAATTRSKVSSASGLLYRNIKAAIGVSANTPPAINPAASPNQRFTAAYSTQTAATPSSASGTSSDQLLTPKRRAEMSMTHNAAGGLSTVMKLLASKEP